MVAYSNYLWYIFKIWIKQELREKVRTLKKSCFFFDLILSFVMLVTVKIHTKQNMQFTQFFANF